MGHSQTSSRVDHQPACIPVVQSSDALLPAGIEFSSSPSSSSSSPRTDRSASMGLGGNSIPLNGETEGMAKETSFDHSVESRDSAGGSGRISAALMKAEEELFLFSLPVDSEHKATKLKILSAARPHMRAFHLAWFSFFLSFCSAFAAPPLLPVIRDNLNLTAADIGNAGIATVVGAIASRLAMGIICDLTGPRLATAVLMALTVPCVSAMATVTNATGFIVCRFFIGFVLATFVSCQYWMSSMFNCKVVGAANAVAAGWGNLGGGFIQLVMPLVFELIAGPIGMAQFTAWRLSFLLPALIQGCMALAVVFLGQDYPDGQYDELKAKGQKEEDSVWKVVCTAATNYRTWILVVSYGYSFGVELTVDNIIAQYFFDRFSVPLLTAGFIAASFGLMNIFSRPLGGFMSDWASARFGMRGRIWNLWLLQTLGGVFCLILGTMHNLPAAIAVMLIFSFFCQAACGATFGIVPFVSHRALGIVSGLTGAGGNAGSAITQAIFFRGAYTTETGLVFMGVMIICCTLPVSLLYFPQWGGMFLPASRKVEATEENYYLGEYAEEERTESKHEASLKFAANSKGERGPVGMGHASVHGHASFHGGNSAAVNIGHS